MLGSTQRDDVVDGEALHLAGLEVVRRRSGGGAVLLVPDEHVWIDWSDGAVLPGGVQRPGAADGWDSESGGPEGEPERDRGGGELDADGRCGIDEPAGSVRGHGGAG